jgi:hypothetical protein
MLKSCSAFLLLAVLLATSASAGDEECKEAVEDLHSAEQQVQSARSDIDVAQKEYSTCVENEGRENCEDKYSTLQSAQHNLKTAISEYETAGSRSASECKNR